MYELPVPLSYYLSGSAIAVVGSLVVTGRLKEVPERREPAAILGRGWASGLSMGLRLVTGLGFVIALATAAMGFTSIFAFAALWVWMGLVVAFVAINLIFGGVWRTADIWSGLADAWRADNESASRTSLPWWLGPVSVYLLFWFELVSKVGFEPAFLAGFLILYALYAIWIRAKDDQWHTLDPFCTLYEFASRSSFLRISREGIARNSPGAPIGGEMAMPKPLFASLFILLGATSMDNLRETESWLGLREALGMPVPGISQIVDLVYDTIALGLLGIPFFLTFQLAVKLSARSFKVESAPLARAMAWSLAPIGIAYLLAHNAVLFVVTLPLWPRTLIDPFSLGWSLPGLGSTFSEFEPSPALVWFVEVGLVVGGHVLGVLMAHRLVQPFSKGKANTLVSQLPYTLLMSAYTVGTLWLLSLVVVTEA